MELAAFRSESVDFCRSIGMPDDFVYRLAKLWNETFTCSYFETRARIKAISEQHNASLSGTRFFPYDGERTVPLDGAGYVFVDDDDWFSPDLGPVLAPCLQKGHRALLWRVTNIGSPKQEFPVFYWGLNGRCMTNNYLVSGDWIRQRRSLEDFFSHKAAVRTLGEEPGLLQLDRCLSVASKGPTSTMSLIRGLGRSREKNDLRGLLRGYLEQMRSIGAGDLAHIEWARPLLDETIAAYQQVYDSR
jgi:hypothetical protein